MYSDTLTNTQTVEQLSEAKYSKETTLGLSTGQSIKTIDMPYMSIARIMGQPFTESDNTMYAAVSSSPTDPAYFIFRCASADGTTATTVTWKVDLIYDCVFKDLNPFYSS
jgi:hypothetical protein